jgi:hypothetical protein
MHLAALHNDIPSVAGLFLDVLIRTPAFDNLEVAAGSDHGGYAGLHDEDVGGSGSVLGVCG